MNTRHNIAPTVFAGVWIFGCFWLATVIEAHPMLSHATRFPLFW